MITLNYNNVDASVIGKDHGLNLEKEFSNYKNDIEKIIKDLNQRKDKPGRGSYHRTVQGFWRGYRTRCLRCQIHDGQHGIRGR